MKIAMTPCTSSNIQAYGYDAASQTLAVQFVGSGSTYHYPGVPAEKYAEMQAAESKGRFFGQQIRPNFKGEKQEPEEKQETAAAAG